MTKGNPLSPASIQARLLDHAKKTRQDFNRVLERYALERFLYRLSQSQHVERFVLKGALMMVVWLGENIRPTRDADLLGFGDLDDNTLLAIFREVCAVTVDTDGMAYLPETLAIDEIRENDAYGGRRITLRGQLGNAKLRIQVDVGIGDAITPEPQWLEYPSLLEMPPARLRGYHPETAIAEKLHIIVTFGMANSRMKDFFDIAALADQESFDGNRLAESIRATFERRKTELPTEIPVALTEVFASDTSKSTQWTAFIEKNGMTESKSLAATIENIRRFAWPVVHALAQKTAFNSAWPPNGPWRNPKDK